MRQKLLHPQAIWFYGFCFLVTRFFLWAHVNPMFQGPDEPAHLAMIAQLDRNNFAHYRNTSATTWLEFEDSFDYKGDYYHQAGVAARYDNVPHYAHTGVWGPGELEHLHHPKFDATPGIDNFRHNMYAYPPVYYAAIAWGLKIYRHLFPAKVIEYPFLARMLSFGFYWLFVWAFVHLALELLPKPAAILSVALVLCLPALVFLPTAVNNDTGVLAFTSLHALYTVRAIKDFRPRWMVGVGVSSLFLSLTKTNGVGSAAILIALLALALWLQAEKKRASYAFSMLLIPIACQMLSTRLFGQFVLAGVPDALTKWQYVKGFLWMFYNHMLPNTFGQFAWFEIWYPLFVYRLFQVFFLGACLFGLFVTMRSLLPKVSQINLRISRPLFSENELNALCVSVLLASFLVFWMLLFVYQWKIVHQVGIVAQGRYAIAEFPFLVIALVWSTQERPWRKIANRVFAVIAAFWFVCSYTGLGMVIRRFFWDNTIESWSQVYERILQYKPAYFKGPMVHFGVSLLHVAAFVILVAALIKEDLKHRALNQG